MNPQSRKSYPHVVLHAVTGLLAIAALALAAYNFREAKRAKDSAKVKPGAVLHEKEEFVSSEKEVKKKGVNDSRPGKKSQKKKKTAARTTAGKDPVSGEKVDPARSRGLDEIVTDLVNSAIE